MRKLSLHFILILVAGLLGSQFLLQFAAVQLPMRLLAMVALGVILIGLEYTFEVNQRRPRQFLLIRCSPGRG